MYIVHFGQKHCFKVCVCDTMSSSLERWLRWSCSKATEGKTQWSQQALCLLYRLVCWVFSNRYAASWVPLRVHWQVDYRGRHNHHTSTLPALNNTKGILWWLTKSSHVLARKDSLHVWWKSLQCRCLYFLWELRTKTFFQLKCPYQWKATWSQCVSAPRVTAVVRPPLWNSQAGVKGGHWWESLQVACWIYCGKHAFGRTEWYTEEEEEVLLFLKKFSFAIKLCNSFCVSFKGGKEVL